MTASAPPGRRAAAQRAVRVGKLGGNPVGDGAAHAGKCPRQVRGDTVGEHQLAGVPVDAAPDVDTQLGVSGQPAVQLPDHAFGIDGACRDCGAVRREDAPAADFRLHLRAPLGAGAVLQPAVQGLQRRCCVSGQAHLHGVPVADVLLIDVDLHRTGVPGRRIELGPGVVGADNQEGVAVRHQVRACGGPQMPHGARHERQILIHIWLAQKTGGDPGAKLLRHGNHLPAGVPGSLPHEQGHPLG